MIGSFPIGHFAVAECRFTIPVPPVPTPEIPPITGGPGGSNRAGKKKHIRKGHAVSAIQTPPEWYYDILPDETDVEDTFTSHIESVIQEQNLQINTVEQLVEAVTEALKEFEQIAVHTTVAKALRKAQVASYKKQVKINAQIAEQQQLQEQRKLKRRREEEALIQILMFL